VRRVFAFMTSILKAGRYEIVAELGRGAMGVVYKANDPVIGRPVAVKTIKLSEQGTGLTRSELIARFQTEARAAGLLTHHNIVVVYDAGEEDGLFYITMELVEGKSVQALLDAGHAFPLPRVLRIMEQACNALQFAHENNIIHRDIKPANIMLTGDDTVKVTDFGTAKILQFGTVQQTAHVMGTPSYMSPEQVKGRAVDGRTDIFSLGVMLYEMITGEKPFPGESITTVIYKIVNEVPVPPRTIDPTIHPGISTAVMRALAKEPEDRYQSCHEFLEDLRNYRNLASESNSRTTVPSLGNRNAAPNATVAMNPGLRGLAADNPHMTPARRPSDGLAEPYAPSPLQSSLMRRTDQIPAYVPPEEKSLVRTVLAAIAMVAVIGFGAYKLKPVLYDVRHPEVRRDAIANTAAQSSAAENAPAATGAETSTPQPDAAATTAQTSQQSNAMQPNATPNATQSNATPSNATQASAAQSQPSATEKPESQQNAQQSASTAATSPIDSTPQPAQVAAAEKTTPEKVVTEKPATEKVPVNAEETPRKQPAVAKTPAGLTAKAAQVKKKIDDALAERNLTGKASVQGVGNTLMLTGKLRPTQHAALLNLLHDVPAGVKIVDNIGDDSSTPAAPSSASTTASVTPKAQNTAPVAQNSGSTTGVAPAQASHAAAPASANSDAPKVTGSRVAWANVTSSPAGAEIYIDDFPTGQKTPARVQVSSGVHVFVLHMEGFKDVRNGVDVSDGGTVAVSGTLHRQ
jgi:serine/threonine protein kinase